MKDYVKGIVDGGPIYSVPTPTDYNHHVFVAGVGKVYEGYDECAAVDSFNLHKELSANNIGPFANRCVSRFARVGDGPDIMVDSFNYVYKGSNTSAQKPRKKAKKGFWASLFS